MSKRVANKRGRFKGSRSRHNIWRIGGLFDVKKHTNAKRKKEDEEANWAGPCGYLRLKGRR